MLVLTWIKGEPLQGGLVDDILKAIGLERETVEGRQRRRSSLSLAPDRGEVSEGLWQNHRGDKNNDDDDGA